MLMSFTFMNHFNRTCMAVAEDPIRGQFHLDEIQMGKIYSAFLLAYVLCMTPGGWFSDRKGAWLALTISAFGTAFFCMLTGVAGLGVLASVALPSFLAIRFMMGIFTAPLFPAAGRAVHDWIPASGRAWANGLVLGATTVGVSLSHTVFGWLMDRVGWRVAFGITGAITALLALLWSRLATSRPQDHPGVDAAELNRIETGQPQRTAEWSTETEVSPPPCEAPPSERTPRESGLLSLLMNPGLMLLTGVYAAVGYYEYMLFYWMEHYFKDVMEFSSDDSRLYAMIVPLAMVITMPLGGWLSDRLVPVHGYRIGRASIPVLGMLASAVLLFVATQAEERFWVVFWFFMAHGAIGLCEAPMWVTALELGGRHRSTSAAIVNTGGNAGGFISPMVTPWLSQMLGWQWGMGAGSLVCLVAVFFWLGIDPTPRRPRGGDPRRVE